MNETIDYNTIVIYFKPETEIPPQERPATAKAAVERMWGDKIAEILPKGVSRHRPKTFGDYKDKRIEDLMKENQRLKQQQHGNQKEEKKENVLALPPLPVFSQKPVEQVVAELHKQGKDVKAISKETGLHHMKVKQIIKSVQ